MNWFKRKPKNVIPNPRDKRRKLDAYERWQRETLALLQFFVFAIALLILAVVGYAPSV